MHEIVLSVDEARALITRALVASNTRKDNAESVADALIGAELCGQPSHGLRRVGTYAAQARAGKIDGNAIPVASQPRPGAVLIDAGNGFAYPAIDLAILKLSEIVPAQGIGVACIRRSNHAGVTGLAVERIAELGHVGLMFANAPASIAPWGSRKPLFGTNPIAFACPAGSGGPVVVDLSMSKVARGKIMAAKQKGEPIPEGWAFGPDGKPTTDPAAGLAGTMEPFGGPKGTVLAMMVELLSAGLSGANFGYEQSSFFDDQGAPSGSGQTIIAIDPGMFGDRNAVIDRFAHMAAMVADCESARVPGARRRKIRAEMLRGGITADRRVVDEIRSQYDV